jgi:hypothetical protein
VPRNRTMNSLPHKNTTRLPLRFTLLTAAIVTATCPAFAEDEPQAIKSPSIVVKDFLGRDRIIYDSDGDGWDDLWCGIFRDLKHRNQTTDTDEDGLTDYEEMVMWRDPFVEGPMPKILTPEEIAEAKRKAELAKEARLAELARTWPARKAILDKTLVEAFPAGNKEGDPEAIRPNNAAWRERLRARRDAAMANRLQEEARLEAIRRKYSDDQLNVKGTLVGDSENGPIFMTPQDAVSANTIFADDVWPTGLYSWQNTALSRNLTGSGIKASIWEASEEVGSGVAGIRTTHSEFSGGRAVQIDSTSVSNHATAVANTIIGGGTLDLYQGAVNQGKLLRGIAYEGEVDGHDLALFTMETSDAVLDGQSISNHSYGISGGWEIRLIAGNNWWYWNYPAFSEDPRLGAYSDAGTGDTSSESLDDFVYTAEVHLPVYASGNPNNFGPGSAVTHAIISGGNYVTSTATRDWVNGDDSYDTVISPATAKNVLTVGSITDINFTTGTFSISDFSGTGPTDDGRIKPDLVAVGERNSSLGFGDSLFAAHKTSNSSYYNGILADSNGNVNLQGTSFAAPAVTGGLMLAEHRRKQLFPLASPLLASTWRAASVHTALELGDPGPSYPTGWGSFDTERLVSLLEDDDSTGRGTLIKEFTISTGVPKTFYVTLPADTQGDITLAWSDPAGNPSTFGSVVDDSTAMLVNDINLVAVDAATSTPHLPWILNPDFSGESAAVRGAAATRGTDDRNNLEKVTIDTDTQERRLAVTITPNGTLLGGSQKVSLILSGVEPEAPQVVSSGFTQNPSNLDEYAVTFSSDPGAFYTLETSTTLQSGSWSDVSTFKAEDSTTTVLTTRDTGSTKQFWRVRRGE